MSHAERDDVSAHVPVLITLRLREGLPTLRRTATWEVLTRAFEGAAEQSGCRLVHLSVQSNHLHLLVEARNRRALGRGMQGLCVRLARGLNRHWGRKGVVFADRYHARALRTPREVRNALVYVLQNARKHGWRGLGLDPYSSARDFDGWSALGAVASPEPGPVGPLLAPPRSWLLRTGWRRHGLIRASELPRAPG